MGVADVISQPVLTKRNVVLRVSRRKWERSYVAAVIAIDAGAALVAAATAYVGRFGDHPASIYLLGYIALSASLPVLWLAAMSVARAYETRFLTVGYEEFRRVLIAAVAVIATVGTFSWATKAEVARGYVIIALPLATMLTLLGRYSARKFVHHRRRSGDFMSDVLLVGHGRSAADLVRQMRRDAHHGMRIVGACVPNGSQSEELAAVGIPVLGSFEDVDKLVPQTGADAVAVLACPEMDGSGPSSSLLEPRPLRHRLACGTGADGCHRTSDRHTASLRVTAAARRRARPQRWPAYRQSLRGSCCFRRGPFDSASLAGGDRPRGTTHQPRVRHCSGRRVSGFMAASSPCSNSEQ